MGSLFPLRSEVDADPEGSRLLGIDEDAADEVFDVLSSRTARSILAAVYERPRPASDLADAADTSIQNARYHLDRLGDAGLVTVADTWYSERGTEMKVYAPANDSVVVMAGDEETTRGAFSALRRLLGAVLAAGVGGLLVQALASPRGGSGSSGTAGASGTTTTASGGGFGAMDVGNTTTTTTTTAHSASAAGHGGPLDAAAGALGQPGVAFFLGGVCVVGLVAAWAYAR